MDETRQLPQRNGPTGPAKRPLRNNHIPSIKQMARGGRANRYSSEGAGDYLFLPIGDSGDLMDTSQLAKE